MYWDRFDICEAYYWYAVTHHTGQNSPEYAIRGRLAALNFSPGLSTQHGKLSENAQAIYERLVAEGI